MAVATRRMSEETRMTVRGRELEASSKTAYFAKMAERISHYLEEENTLAAYVVAFSFLEDRVGAMHAERCRVDGVIDNRNMGLSRKIGVLERAGDLSPDLVDRCRTANQQRNDLFHNAMWNLDGFTQEAAGNIYALARELNNARGRQQRTFEQLPA